MFALRKGNWPRRRVVALATLLSVAASWAVVAPSPSQAAISDCPNVLLIGARGSGEAPQGEQEILRTDWDSAAGLGTTVAAYAGALSNGVGARSFKALSVKYPARPVSDAWNDVLLNNLDGGLYASGAADGAVAMAAMAGAYARDCGSRTQIVLAGYSQGAWLMHAALWMMTDTERAQVKSVVAFGDPVFDSSAAWARLMGARYKTKGVALALGANGAVVGLPAAGVPKALAPVTSSYCIATDPVCDVTWVPQRSIVISAAYVSGRLLSCGVSLLNSGCAHFKYRQNGVTSQAATLSGAALSKALQITNTSLPPATSGQPYSATLSAAGGRLPYSWSVTAGVLPVGLTLAPNGTITGTPTTPSTASFTIAVRDKAKRQAAAAFSIVVSGSTPPGGGGSGYQVFGYTGASGVVIPVASTEPCPPGTGSVTKVTSNGIFGPGGDIEANAVSLGADLSWAGAIRTTISNYLDLGVSKLPEPARQSAVHFECLSTDNTTTLKTYGTTVLDLGIGRTISVSPAPNDVWTIAPLEPCPAGYAEAVINVNSFDIGPPIGVDATGNWSPLTLTIHPFPDGTPNQLTVRCQTVATGAPSQTFFYSGEVVN